ncbi:MAG: hypothetical protein ACMUJM_09725 [bacterium]
MGDTQLRNKRRTYLIKKVFQTKFIIIFLCLVLAGSVISGTIFYFKTNVELGEEYGKAHSKLKKTGEVIQPNLVVSFGVGIILVALATIMLTVLVSHKVAGPLYRFENSAREISKGNLSINTRIRDSDQTQELSDAFTAMTEQLREKIGDIKGRSNILNQKLSEFTHVVDSKKKIARDEIIGQLDEINKMSSELENCLQFFTLS